VAIQIGLREPPLWLPDWVTVIRWRGTEGLMGLFSSRQPKAPSPRLEPANEIPITQVDFSKRYDVYCAELNQAVVYRNVLFKGIKKLQQFTISEFMELEQANGQTIFVARNSVIK